MQYLIYNAGIARIGKDKPSDNFVFLLGNTILDVRILSTIYFTHFEDLNFNISTSGSVAREYYEKIGRLTCTIDNSNIFLTIVVKGNNEEPTHYKQLVEPIVSSIRLASDFDQFDELILKQVKWTLNCVEGLVAGTTNGVYLIEMIELFDDRQVYELLVKLVCKIDNLEIVVRVLRVDSSYSDASFTF